ncbi:DUF1499 domain-containing protein [Pseudohoeflea suaedae]|uniref:DUF1499 domain-containing protein n=1 Tax=Pseudohoeflea suaedae TaxID=877384 RepID=A0A4R5PP00_9HYPH|nr:DUF1499 domain-containing protein [Pseudohoeflea suaedae]TDH38719.1 DUF1499 domain-containing protein [Pseudohoeflea suaedae]
MTLAVAGVARYGSVPVRFQQASIPMPYRPERPVSIAAVWSRRLGLFALALALTTFVLQRFEMIALANAIAVILLAAAIAILAVAFAAIGFTMLWLIGARGGHASFWGMMMALVVLTPVGVGAARYITLPPIHDVTTDSITPPEWLEEPPIEASWLPRSKTVDAEERAEQFAAYPQLTGRRYGGAIDRVLEAISALTQERKWKLVETEGADFLVPDQEPPGAAQETTKGESVVPIPVPRPETGDGVAAVSAPVVRLQFTDRSLILGLRQDIMIRLVEEEETTFVDVRAATRTGQHDLGLNARLLEGFLHDLDVALLGIAGG